MAAHVRHQCEYCPPFKVATSHTAAWTAGGLGWLGAYAVSSAGSGLGWVAGDGSAVTRQDDVRVRQGVGPQRVQCRFSGLQDDWPYVCKQTMTNSSIQGFKADSEALSERVRDQVS